MDVTGYLSLARVDQLSRSLEVTANNLANASTDGFKQQKVLFSDYLSKQKLGDVEGGEKAIQYSQDRSTYLDTDQGALRQTGNPLDLGINGDGYFMIKTQNGIQLTRAGQFQRSDDGTIVDYSGNPILNDQKEPIQLQGEDQILPLGISSDGTVSTERGVIGKIALMTVDNPNTLHAEGSKLFSPKNQNDLIPAKMTDIRQGMLESSNVNAIDSTTQMVKIQREYDLNFQLLQNEFTRRSNAIDKIAQQSEEA